MTCEEIEPSSAQYNGYYNKNIFFNNQLNYNFLWSFMNVSKFLFDGLEKLTSIPKSS